MCSKRPEYVHIVNNDVCASQKQKFEPIGVKKTLKTSIVGTGDDSSHEIGIISAREVT